MAAHKPAQPKEDDDPQAATPAGKQALIAKDAAQAIHAKLSMKPYEADRQIMIIWRPELMNETDLSPTAPQQQRQVYLAIPVGDPSKPRMQKW